jgi:hypothetical protein
MAAASDNFIPRPDADFSAWVNAYSAALKLWWESRGFDKHQLDGLTAALDAWNASWGSLTAARARAAAASADKSGARQALEPMVREFARLVQANEKTTNAERLNLGLTVRDQTPTPTPTPTSRPLLRIENTQRLQHRLRFVDESTPTRTRKPRGAAGAEVWLALVFPHEPPPPMGQAYRFVQLTSRPEALTEFVSRDAGKTACYALRWVTATGARGPWSEVATATVAA